MKVQGRMVGTIVRFVFVVALALMGFPGHAVAEKEMPREAVTSMAEASENLSKAANSFAWAAARLASLAGESPTAEMAETTALLTEASNVLTSAATESDPLSAFEMALQALHLSSEGLHTSARKTVDLLEINAAAERLPPDVASRFNDALQTLVKVADQSIDVAEMLHEMAMSAGDPSEVMQRADLLTSATAVLASAAAILARAIDTYVGSVEDAQGSAALPLPVPVLCNPEDPVLQPLGTEQLDIRPVESEYGGYLSADRLYQNENGQIFRLTVNSQREEEIRQYLDNVSVCLEAVPVFVDAPDRIFGNLPSAGGSDAQPMDSAMERLQQGADLLQTLLFDFNDEERNVVVDVAWLPEQEMGRSPGVEKPEIGARSQAEGRFLPVAFPNPSPSRQESPLPDLIPFLDPSGSATAGEELALVVGVGNEGDGPALGTSDAAEEGMDGYMLDVILSRDESVPEGWAVYSPNFREDVLLAGGRISNTPSLGSGDSVNWTLSVGIPGDIPGGRYFVCVQVDPPNAVPESDETNNVACVPISVAGTQPPDEMGPSEPGTQRGPSGESGYVLYFVLDPPIEANQWHGYQAQCHQSAQVQMRVQGGSATVLFRRNNPYTYLGDAFARAAGPSLSRLLSASSYPEYRSYDVTVVGGQSGSQYTLTGRWTRGVGGGCP